MTIDYKKLIEEAQAFVPQGVRVDMWRHPGNNTHDVVHEPTYWLFVDNTQIGSVTREAARWRAVRYWKGYLPSAQHYFIDLPDALRFACEVVGEVRSSPPKGDGRELKR